MSARATTSGAKACSCPQASERDGAQKRRKMEEFPERFTLRPSHFLHNLEASTLHKQVAPILHTQGASPESRVSLKLRTGMRREVDIPDVGTIDVRI